MFVYGADFFLFRPGIVLTLLGLVLTLPLTLGPVASARSSSRSTGCCSASP